MKMSDGERLIVVMLAEIMDALKLKTELDANLIEKLARGGDDWAIRLNEPGIFHDGAPTEEEVSETTEILQMWRIVERALGELTGEDSIAAKTWHTTGFEGFDGNNDPHYGVAKTLINDLGSYVEFNGRDLNSHSQSTLVSYRKTLERFEKHKPTMGVSQLDFDALKEICNP